ncbi:MAG: saccharopine dehydrogenase NADP-binding domain-containing protein [Desulfacinum sp.]|jgi:saccharopine dehydrogenase-like NADP-dependent oxidoreductase|nr:saccharopine dehydrogenase NADP-binding domain-containing protein [Desulfacinum sp.]MBZ4660409.1 Saccharopine dehydrogenase [Desulfacinum sp.]
MKILVLGVGLQGKAVLHDLERSEQVREIVAADMNAEAAEDHVRRKGYRKTTVVHLDATSTEHLERLLRSVRPHAVICMLPPHFGFKVAEAAVACGVHFVSSSYTGDLVRLADAARSAGVTLLPEMGMDPGIDLVLCRLALEELDRVHGLHSYGAGVPEPACADHNPLRYKISWTFDGVLKAYKRPARFLAEGREVRVAEGKVFRPEYGHTVEVPGLGTLEAYPNGDAVAYMDTFGLGREVQAMGRFALRWPGHNALVNALSELGFLEDAPVDVGGCSVSPRQFLVHHLTPRLTFADDERDVVILLARAWGLKGGEPRRVSYWLMDYRDLETGLFAMNRTVGYTAAIGAQLILNGTITRRGLLNPARDVPPDVLLSELERRGMTVQKQVEDHGAGTGI